MEPNERHHHHHQDHHQQQHLTSPYYNPFHHHNPTTVSAAPSTTSAGNSIPSSNNGNLPLSNDGSSSIAVYPHSVPSSAVTAPIDPVKRKRGRPRKYETPAQALAAKKLASSASNSSARERREQAAAAAASGGVTPASKSGSRKSILGSVGKTGQSFTPHIVNITPGEDVAQKIVHFAQQSKHELCVLSASGSISNASLTHMASGTSVSYEGQYEILSLSGSYIRGENGGKTGGLSVCLSSSDGQIFGGGVGGLLKAAGPVQVILGTFQLEKKKDGRNDVKGDDASGSGNMLASPSATESLIGFHPGMESSGRNPNDEHHNITSSGMGGGAHFMMQQPQGMHMTHARPSVWGGSAGYDLSGLRGNGSSENGDYE
ncbi:AT-hook motif nuclear-localized protein 14 [Cardamine amara subsp. amara]|uniref:AT-hook motif nuclear-localized protein n=1 Tax=Cardamine amara subsp. amara TaxID=228776 RepID=A0ABD1C708_CARAN